MAEQAQQANELVTVRVDMVIEETSYAGIRRELDRIMRPWPELSASFKRTSPSGWPEVSITGLRGRVEDCLVKLGYDLEDVLS